MTNEDYIKSLPIKELAIALINVNEVPNYIDDDGTIHRFTTAYLTSDGMQYFDDYEGALEHECWWLVQERRTRKIDSSGKDEGIQGAAWIFHQGYEPEERSK